MPNLPTAQLKKLIQDNSDILSQLSNAANGAITGYLRELERNGGIYLCLSNPKDTSVTYGYVQSRRPNWEDVRDKLAIRLGLKVTATTIAVNTGGE